MFKFFNICYTLYVNIKKCIFFIDIMYSDYNYYNNTKNVMTYK